MTSHFHTLNPSQRNASYGLASQVSAATFARAAASAVVISISVEDRVDDLIAGNRQPSALLRPLVEDYNRLRRLTDECTSYPASIDQRMNALYDALKVLA